MSPFDADSAKKYLKEREEKARQENERLRLAVLAEVMSALKEELFENNVEVFLVGSITRPFTFTKRSDVDIVVKNFTQDRFDLWTKLESRLGRNVEVILFENCSFKNHIEKEGLRVR